MPNVPWLHRMGRFALVGAGLLLIGVPAVVLSNRGATTSASSTWYVSQHGNGRGGSSWTTAWPELNRISWSLIGPGDRIVLDGGRTTCPSNYVPRPGGPRPGLRCGALYRTELSVGASGIPGAPITISLSTASGHDGTAVVFGGRATPLPYCDQPTYSPMGRGRDAGIDIPGRTHVVIDGSHRSGIMVYGAQSGVDLAGDGTGYVTLRNLEVFDNGMVSTWAHGYRTDGEGISVAGHDILIDRNLVHDNGQDAVQDRDTGVPTIGHAPLHDISVTNSWLYEHREHPEFAGYGFNSGAQEIAAQACTHVDGVQIWGGGLHQQRMTFAHDIFGPFLAQGVFPGDLNTASFDHVSISDTLFLNMLDHAVEAPRSSSDPHSPHGWKISTTTSYMTDQPNRGLSSHGKIDMAGTGHSVTNSLFYNGYFGGASTFTTAAGNVWWRGDPAPGGVNQQPSFVGPMPTNNRPSYATLAGLNLTPRCTACSGVGSNLHDVTDLLRRIDALDRPGTR
jgi:hypothetical protein